MTSDDFSTLCVIQCTRTLCGKLTCPYQEQISTGSTSAWGPPSSAPSTTARLEPPALIDGLMEADLRKLDPSTPSGQRQPSKLEGHYRTLGSLFTVAVANYTRLGQNEPVFNSFVQRDHRLLYVHCLLKESDAADVLRTDPTGAPCEVGLPNRTRVKDTEPSPANRAKVS